MCHGNKSPHLQVADINIYICLLHNALLQPWTTHKYGLLSSKCCLRHGMVTRMLQGMSTPLSKLLSLCLSLFSQCSTAVLLCTCPDRLRESHSKFELTRNINSLHHTHIHVLLARSDCIRSKSLAQRRWKLTPWWHFERLKSIDEDTCAVTRVEPVTFSVQSFILSQGHSASHKLFTLLVHCRMSTVSAADNTNTSHQPIITSLQ